MIDRTMTEDDLAAQAERYGHHYFRTCRQAPIRINDKLKLKSALAALEEADRRLTCARVLESTVSGAQKYASAQADVRDAEEAKDDAKAQAMAAFWRETGMWPYQVYSLGLR